MGDWITTKEIMVLAGCGENRARELLKKANTQSKKEGNEIPNRFKANRKRIMKLIGLKEEKSVVRDIGHYMNQPVKN